jgi:hypothetical protein
VADYYINVFLDDQRQKQIEEAGLGSGITEIGGKKAIQVEMSKKEHKKLVKGFPDLQFDDSNACTLPEEPEKTLMNLISEHKTLDIMKVAILKLYNPLAGKSLREKL